MPKTVAEIAAMACRSVGVQEDYAQVRACDYVRERMEYLWTGWALRDTLILFRITAVSAVVEDVPGGTSPVGRVYQLPVDRVLKVGWEGQSMRPGDLITAFQRGGDSFEDGGSGVYAIEQGAGSVPGTRLVRIVSAPTANPISLIVLGKKAMPTIADSDTLPLAGVDFAILPMVRGDLWKDRRQFGKAQIEYQEGQGMVQKMLDQELKQAMGVRRLVGKPFGGTYYGLDRRGSSAAFAKTSNPAAPLWELDGEGNIVPTV